MTQFFFQSKEGRKILSCQNAEFGLCSMVSVLQIRAAEYIFVPGTANFEDPPCPLRNDQIIQFLLGFCARWGWFVPCTVRISPVSTKTHNKKSSIWGFVVAGVGSCPQPAVAAVTKFCFPVPGIMKSFRFH